MHETPPSEAIRQAVSIHLNMLSRQTRRDYAGLAVGQRRRLAIVPFIAQEMTARILEQVTLADVEADATAEAVAKRIEAMLISFPQTEAFLIASHNAEEAEAARRDLARLIALDLLKAYTPASVAHQPQCAASHWNGWKMWEAISVNEQPRYRWRRTWSGKADDDFIGFDGDQSLGRIFRIDHIQQRDKWFWLLGYPGSRLRRECPASGWEQTMRQAACRVERCYKAVVDLNRRTAP